MLGRASSSQPGAGVSGSGAVSHVYIQYPPLRCGVSGSKGLFYDDGNKLLLCPTSDQVLSWKTVPFNPLVAPTSDSISDGPVLSIRYSLDAKFLAIQRSNNEVQFWNRETGETFSQRCRSESEGILGFFWTDCQSCDVVFVKTSGLDLFSYDFELKALRLVETKRSHVSWYVYTHESRLVLLASGMQCKSFIGYQLSAAGIIRLPRFEMAMAKSEANNKPVLGAEDVHIVTVYGRIYCLQVDRVAMLLHSYRFYRDAVIQQGSLPIYSSKVALSVVDNVLLVHQVDAKVVILYDIFADSRAPISAPLPLLLRGSLLTNNISSSRSNIKAAESSEAKEISDAEATIYGDGWNFLVPDIICDVAKEFLWKIHLDLEAISASSSELPLILEFLQRRKLEANKAKHLCLETVRTVILERRPVAMVARAIDVLITSYSHSTKAGSSTRKTSPVTDVSSSRVRVEPSVGVDTESQNKSLNFSTSDSDDNVNVDSLRTESRDLQYLDANSVSQQHESRVDTAAISPDEMYNYVFATVDEEMTGDTSYLVSIVVEFLHSANVEKIKVHSNIYVLAIQLLARNERCTELGLFVINKIIEPSKEVAMQLLESGRQNFQTRKLGLDMLRQLSLHHDYVLLLVQDGYYLEALRYARKNMVNTLRPALFLEAAFASNNSQHLAAVLRFFSDFIPSFRDTSDHITYFRILNEMNSANAA